MTSLQRNSCVVLSAILSLLPGALHGQSGTALPVAPKAAQSSTLSTQKNGRTLPLVFEANQGQFPSEIGFVGRTEQYAVAIGPKDLRFALPGAHGAAKVVVSLRNSQAAAPAGLTEAPFRTNYYLGSDPAAYRTGIRNYTRVGLQHVYPGIDAEFYAAGNTIEHDFFVAPGADASRISMGIAGAARLPVVGPAGDVVIAAGDGELRLKKPVAYQQDVAGKRTDVAAAFVLTGTTGAPVLGFQLGEYDHSRRLVIDPVIVYGSFFDGKAGSAAAAVVSDAAGHVYLAGSTSSASGDFGVAAASTSVDPAGLAASSTNAVAFVARFNPVVTTPASAGASVAWLSYFGSKTASSTATSVALSAAAITTPYVAVGGSTLATDFPGAVTALPAIGTATGVQRGFVATLSPTTGALSASAYVSSSMPADTTYLTEVDAVAVDAVGNLYAAGKATGPNLTTLLMVNALPVDTSGTAQKGFVVELPQALATTTYATYIAGSGTPAPTTAVTSVTVDSATPADIYVGGYTAGNFPQAGTYNSLPVLPSPAPVGEPYVALNAHNGTGNDAFAAELTPGAASTTIEYSVWLAGGGDQEINAVALDTSQASSGLYLFGQTTSTDLLAKTTYTYAGGTPVATPTGIASTATPVTAAKPSAAANTSGFVADLSPTGLPLVETYVGGAGAETITAGTVDKNGTVYAAGTSTSSQTMGYTTTLLPAAEDLTAASTQHGYLLQLPGNPAATGNAAALSAVNYIANIGSTTGPDSAVGVTVDGTPNAYVAGNISTAGAPFTVFPGFELTRNATAGAVTSAYLAEVATAPTDLAPSLTLAAVPCPTATSQPNQPVGCPDPIGYPVSGSPLPTTYTWSITPAPGSNTVFTNVELQIPTQADLTYSSIVLTDTATNAPVAGALCSPTFTKGVVCLLPTYPQSGTAPNATNDPVTIVLTAALKDQPASSLISVTANLYGPGPSATGGGTTTTTDTQSVTIHSNAQAPANLQFTLPTDSATTFFTTNTGATSPNTLVSYAFKVTNATSASATVGTANTTFTVTLPFGSTGFNYNSFNLTATTTAISSAATCTYSSTAALSDSSAPAATITCTGVNLPAGDFFTINVTGTFPDAAIGVTPLPSFGVSASAFLSTPSTSFTPAPKLARGVHLKVTGSLDNNAYILGQTVTYTLGVANSGPSATDGADKLTVTIAPPASNTIKATFTPNASSPFTCITTGTSSTCTATLKAIAAGQTNVQAGQPLVISGQFSDSLGNAVVLETPVAETFTATATLDTETDSLTPAAPADYTTTASPTPTVVRSAPLSIVSPATTAFLTLPATSCKGGSSCLYMTNTADLKDSAPYTFTLQNTGSNVSVGTQVTIALPFAPANPAGTAHPVFESTLSGAGGTPAFGAAVTCSYTGATTNQITCSGNLPPNSSITISGLLKVDANTVPATAAYVTTAAFPGSIFASQSGNATTQSYPIPAIEIDRVAHLVTSKAVVASGTAPVGGSPLTVNLDENPTRTTPGANDSITVTVNVGTVAGLNTLPGASYTDTLPAYFRFTQIPTSTGPNAATCTATVTTAAGTQPFALSTTNYTGATQPVLTCTFGPLAPGNATASGTGTADSVGTPQVTITYAGKFVDNGATAPDITTNAASPSPNPFNKVPSVAVPLLTAVSTTTLAADNGPATDATSTATTITAERLVHMFVRKTRNAAVPAAGKTPNLDEEPNLPASTTFGAADEVEYEVALANGGANQALGVQFTDTLPPYFTVVKMALIAGASTTPDTGSNGTPSGQLAAGSLVCYTGTAATGSPITLPYRTTGRQQITCTYGSSGLPLALVQGPSTAASFDNATSVELVYQGKFQDNAPSVDDVPLGSKNFSVTSNPGDATAVATQTVDSGATADRSSLALASYTVQRAVHLTIVLPTNPVRSLDETATPLSLTGEAEPTFTTGPNGVPVLTGGTPAFNCLRYKAYIQNAGPNIARQPQLTVASANGLVLTSIPTGTTTTPNTNSGTDAALADAGCAYTAKATPSVTVTAGLTPLTEAATGQVPSFIVDLDGYFDVNTLAGVNSMAEVGVSYTALSDASSVDPSGTTFSTVTGSPITVTNTPSGSSFTVLPFSGAATQPVSVNYGTVTAAGITSLAVAPTLPTGASLPKGVSPVPGSSATPINLYKTGSSSPHFYSVGTTAATASTSSNVVCVTSGGAAGTPLTDGFAKPERVLLWALANLPAGTQPPQVGTVTSPYIGDVTSQVLASGGTNFYVEAGGPLDLYNAANTTLPPVQAQPQEVCGKVNGFASAVAPAVFAALEPVNFAPVITPNVNTPSPTPGKGVSEVSFLFPTAVDYNNNDPCYVSTAAGSVPTRSKCDDNLVLTTWVFGGEALIPSPQLPNPTHILPPMTPDVTANFVNTTFEVEGGQTLYYLVNDQLAEINYAAANFCDPGLASSSYRPVTVPAPCPISASALSGTPPQETDFTSGEIAQLVPSLNGGSSALIILPPGATPTSTNPYTAVASGYTAAAGTVTAGQTVGFQWRLRIDANTITGSYNLTCFEVDAATQNTVIPFTPGLSCQVPSSVTLPTDPAIYIVTTGSVNARNHAPSGWKGMGGVVFATLLVPFLLFRRRLSFGKQFITMILLLLGGAVALSGCGSGSNMNGSSAGVAAGTYYFRVSATPVGGGTTITSTAFSVKVAAGS